MRSRLPLLFTLVTATVASPARAQASHYTGVSVERFAEHDVRFVVASVRHTRLGQRGFGVDLAAGLAPQFFPSLLLELDAGLVGRVSLTPATLLLKAGVSNFIIASEFELYPGVQTGLGLLVPLERRCELRLDLARRLYFPQDGRTLHMWSLGAGLTVRGAR